jgi:glutamate/tyrosine decarboxylase-like PLP-dependent enzyme
MSRLESVGKSCVKLVLSGRALAFPWLAAYSTALSTRHAYTAVSINVSGHKYGLALPGVGFVLWRNTACVC